MTIEQSLAAKKIAAMQDKGWQKTAAEKAAAELLRSQGFGEEHSRKVAEEMAGLFF